MILKMAYKTEDLFNTAIEQIKKHKLFFIEDIISFMPCAKSTFYEHFPNESNYYKKMFEELERNRTELKVSMRSKWYKSNAPALQMALMKLIATPEELRKLSMNHQVTEEVEKPIFKAIDLDVTEDDGAG
jgi:hypothetical protein